MLKPLLAILVTAALAPCAMGLGRLDVAAVVDAHDVYGRVVVAHCDGCAFVAIAPLRCRAGVVSCFKFLVCCLLSVASRSVPL